MNKMLAIFCGTVTAVFIGGCAQLESAYNTAVSVVCEHVRDMQLDPKPQPRIQEIVEKHQQQINRAEELNILCDKAWVPVYIKGQEGVDGKNSIALPPEVQSYVEFQRDGKITGFAGVNVFNGSFAVTAPNQLRFGALVSTLQAGPHLDYEMLFMAQLKDVDHFVVNKKGEIEFMKRSMLMMRCKAVDLKSIKRKSTPKAMTPVPPEVKGKVTEKETVAKKVNPALPTVEKVKKSK